VFELLIICEDPGHSAGAGFAVMASARRRSLRSAGGSRGARRRWRYPCRAPARSPGSCGIPHAFALSVGPQGRRWVVPEVVRLEIDPRPQRTEHQSPIGAPERRASLVLEFSAAILHKLLELTRRFSSVTNPTDGSARSR
jgi:hypothetical protein